MSTYFVLAAGISTDPMSLVALGALGLSVMLIALAGRHQRASRGWRERARAAESELSNFKARALYEDPATGLGNQNQLDADCGKLVARQRRHGEPFGVALVEVSNVFKPNDPLGPGSLAAAAQVLLEASRLEDSVCRLSERTFAVLLARSDTHGAENFLERVRATLSSQPWKDGGSVVYLSVFGGVAEWDETMRSTRDLVTAAVNARDSYRTELERQQRRFAPQISA